ncbi:MAG: hypothetical protein PHT18_06110 [Proteiniphilum sp.]|nr:hypothetical protein [Proteiniphilum sp.]
MKAIKTHLILTAIALMLTSCYATRGAYAQGGYYNDYDDGQGYYNEYDEHHNGGISFNVFYNELRPYGRWINHRAHGRVWIPNVGGNFHPYATNGYWVMTDYGNTWVSDYSWGWAPFHYGRWYYDDYYGWAWVPGYEWAPAWVTWRSGGGYYGWAPMGPGLHINIHINLPARYWTFLPNRYMYHRNMHRHYNRYSPAIYNRTTIVNNTYIYNDNRYYSGPSASDYRRETGRTATVRRLESSTNRSGRATTRVSNNAVQVYRPEATSGRSANTREAVNQRNSTARQTTTAPAVTSRSSRDRNSTISTQSSSGSSRSSVTTPQRSNSTTRQSTASPATRSNSSSTRNSSATQQRSSSGNNRSSTVRSTSTSSNNRSATTTRSSSSNSNNRESSSSGRSSGRR